MRLVFCQCKDVDEARSYATRMANVFENKDLKTTLEEDNTLLVCNGYRIKFVGEREWLVLTTTQPGKGYLTIPYNQILNNPAGVKKEDCTIDNLVKLVVKGYK